jgi:hypothetical protein
LPLRDRDAEAAARLGRSSEMAARHLRIVQGHRVRRVPPDCDLACDQIELLSLIDPACDDQSGHNRSLRATEIPYFAGGNWATMQVDWPARSRSDVYFCLSNGHILAKVAKIATFSLDPLGDLGRDNGRFCRLDVANLDTRTRGDGKAWERAASEASRICPSPMRERGWG